MLNYRTTGIRYMESEAACNRQPNLNRTVKLNF